MYRWMPFILMALTVSAQTPPLTLDKPPLDIDDALRARIKQFYDYHVANKTRQCEPLISEDAKDDFYVMNKPALQSFKIGNIEYSEHFTRAKVVIVGMMPALLPMAGAKIMEQPFASYWRFENGDWFWYYNKQAASVTPFGTVKGDPNAPGAPGSLAVPAEVNIEALQSALKIDRTRIGLSGGKAQTVKVTNTLPGPASLTLDCPLMPLAKTGVIAKFDKKDLKSSETAILTLNADPAAHAGSVPLRITVSPTNQVLDLTVNISR